MSFGWEREAERALRVAAAVLQPVAPLVPPAAPGNPARAFETMLASLLGVAAPEAEEASDAASPAPAPQFPSFGAAMRPGANLRRGAVSHGPAFPAAWPAHGYEAPGIASLPTAGRGLPLASSGEFGGTGSEVGGAWNPIERAVPGTRRAEEWPLASRAFEAPASVDGYAPPAWPESAPPAEASHRAPDAGIDWSGTTAAPAPLHAFPATPNRDAASATPPIARRGWPVAEEGAAPVSRGAGMPEAAAPLRLASNAAELGALLQAHVVPPPEEDSPLFAEPAISTRVVPGAAVPSQAVPAPTFTGAAAFPGTDGQALTGTRALAGTAGVAGATEGAWAAFDDEEPGPGGTLAEEMLVDRLMDRIHDRLRDESIRHFGLTGGSL